MLPVDGCSQIADPRTAGDYPDDSPEGRCIVHEPGAPGPIRRRGSDLEQLRLQSADHRSIPAWGSGAAATEPGPPGPIRRPGSSPEQLRLQSADHRSIPAWGSGAAATAAGKGQGF